MNASSDASALDDVLDPITGEVLARANDEISEDLATEIQNAGIERVRIRSVLTCESRRGVLHQMLRPQSRDRGTVVEIGEAVGVIAAQIDRRAGNAADDANIPHRRHGASGTGITKHNARDGRTAVKYLDRPQHGHQNREGESSR